MVKRVTSETMLQKTQLLLSCCLLGCSLWGKRAAMTWRCPYTALWRCWAEVRSWGHILRAAISLAATSTDPQSRTTQSCCAPECLLHRNQVSKKCLPLSLVANVGIICYTVMDNMQGYTFQLSEQMPENPSKTSVRKYACRVLACPAFVVGTEDAFTVGDRQQAGQKGFENWSISGVGQASSKSCDPLHT